MNDRTKTWGHPVGITVLASSLLQRQDYGDAIGENGDETDGLLTEDQDEDGVLDKKRSERPRDEATARPDFGVARRPGGSHRGAHDRGIRVKNAAL